MYYYKSAVLSHFKIGGFVSLSKSAILSRFKNRLFCPTLKSAVLSRIHELYESLQLLTTLNNPYLRKDVKRFIHRLTFHQTNAKARTTNNIFQQYIKRILRYLRVIYRLSIGIIGNTKIFLQIY